jgi:hypothetical protein
MVSGTRFLLRQRARVVLNRREMYVEKRLSACATAFLAGVCACVALTGSPPALTNASWSGEGFQFTLHGQTNVSYIVESSSDLRTWTPALTNSDSHATRVIVAPAVAGHTFWRVQRPPSPAFAYAIAARSNVTLGGSARIDSFNSTNALESINGRYDPATATDRAAIGCASTNTGAVNVGNMKVYGYVATEPSGTVTLGPNGGVGSKSWIMNPVSAGTIEPGHRREDMNFAFAEAKLPVPFGPAMTPVPGTVGGTNYTYVLDHGDYRASSITLSSSQKMIVIGKARLHVTGVTTVAGNGYILIASDASLELYAGGQVTMGGGGCINSSEFATTFSIIGLATEPLSYSATTRFVGTIYAPSSRVTMTGTTDAVGAVVGSTVEISGSMGLHFDESLKSAGPFF